MFGAVDDVADVVGVHGGVVGDYGYVSGGANDVGDVDDVNCDGVVTVTDMGGVYGDGVDTDMNDVVMMVMTRMVVVIVMTMLYTMVTRPIAI